jgi:hypothetical protein
MKCEWSVEWSPQRMVMPLLLLLLLEQYSEIEKA